MYYSNVDFYRALIRDGVNAGRITDIHLEDGAVGAVNYFDIEFKSSCCGNLCSRYERKQPLSEIAPDIDGTGGEFEVVNVK